METFLFLFEMLGTIAFAASGAVLGVRKGLDVFGVCFLGLTTACGGGMVRDVLLGNTPPAAFQNPTASAVAVVTSLIMFLSGVRHLLMGNQRRYDLFMLLMDSAGLGIFTVMGVRVVWNCVEAPSLYLLVFVGVLTGVGGGLLRDVMAGDMPYIFVKHIYACASLVGAVICGVLRQPAGEMTAMLAGAAAGFITAFLQTKLAVPSILAGIITNTGLYTVNLAVMGFSSNVPMLKTKTVFTAAQGILGESAPYKLIVAALVTVVICALLIAFLGTRLGLSIRATGDNPDMVRASSINTAFTITVGLCIANAMTALSGAVLAQYQRSADINLGTGMVVIGLASLIIGETLFGRGGMWVKAVAAVAGSVIYRFIIALALRANVPSECLKLISAVIVALAIAAPALKAKADFRRRRANAQKGGARHA